MDYKKQTKVSVVCCMKSGNDFKAVCQIQTENTIYVQNIFVRRLDERKEEFKCRTEE